MESPKQIRKVTVRATARLHLGFIDLHGGLDRLYGSLGVSITHPQCVIEIQRLDSGLKISGDDSDRIRALAEQFMNYFEEDGGFEITQWEAIPPHVGLGSGTQLSLALGMGLAALLRKDESIYEISRVAGRGGVSGIGTATFSNGGFVIDGGVLRPATKPSEEESLSAIPPLIARHEVPADWLFIVAIPDTLRGLSGKKEAQAFNQKLMGSQKSTHMVSRLVLMKLLPALVEDRIDRFGQALSTIQNLVGDAFSSAQGGRFASPEVASCVDAMLEAGAYGAGQSSWGPTCYGLARGEKEANVVKQAVTSVLDTSVGGSVFISPVNNKGATILTE